MKQHKIIENRFEKLIESLRVEYCWLSGIVFNVKCGIIWPTHHFAPFMSLVRICPWPFTRCSPAGKIRLLASDEQTLTFCRMVESCGVAALTVHGRTRHERPRHPVHEDAIRRVAEALSIPVIAKWVADDFPFWTFYLCTLFWLFVLHSVSFV